MSSHRSVRLFLSSTFRDFGEERDLLVRQVFPALRTRLKDRFVELVDVDLRWGITAEEAERGEVLPICLAEIDRARPYFIGMLGERYGWIPPPEGYAPDLLERQPWLKKHQGGKSVTELEILHGVLNNRRMKGRAFFYFRSPAYARTKGGAYLPSAEDRARQATLKRRIRERGLPATIYATPEALAKRIERDLWKLLDAEFPALSVPDAFEREWLRHEAYAAPRRRLYLGGDRYQTQLAAALESGEQRIVVEGASGGGKSALLANFFEAYRKRRPRHLVHKHYLGASTDAADPHALVRRLIEFIQRATGSTENIPGDPQKLMDSLPIWLATASAWARKRRTQFIFVLDSLNSLTDQRDLRWWPAFLPRGVTLLVSCLPGPVHDALKGKTEALPGRDEPPKWKAVTVRPLTKAQSATLLNTYLARFNKKLPSPMVKQVQAHPLATNPLFIRTMAEELRLFGVHEELQKRLNSYLTSQTIDDLFERVLERVEKDCGKKQVKAAMTAIWASRAGLTEKEILGIAELTPAAWAAIRFALDEMLLEARGKINFAHQFFRLAVENRLLHNDYSRLRIHRSLANYFARQKNQARMAEEIPFQLSKCQDWQGMEKWLTSLEGFEAMHRFRSTEEHIGYWLSLECVRGKLLIEQKLLSGWKYWKLSGKRCGDVASHLVSFLRESGRGYRSGFLDELAKRALEVSVEINGANSEVTAKRACDRAEVLRETGDYTKSEALLRSALDFYIEYFGEQHSKTAQCLNDLAHTLSGQAKYDEAEVLLRRAVSIREIVIGAQHPDTAVSLNNLAELLREKTDYKGALYFQNKSLLLRHRSIGAEHPVTASSINNLALIYMDMGDRGRSLSLLRQALKIVESTLGPFHLHVATTLNNLALLHREDGDLAQAEIFMRRALEIDLMTYGEFHPAIARNLINLSALMKEKGELSEAELGFRRAISISEKTNGKKHPDTATALSHLALLLDKEEGNEESNEEVESLYREALSIAEEVLGLRHPDTATKLENLALFLKQKKSYAEATELLQRAVEIRELAVFESSGLDHLELDLADTYRKLGGVISSSNADFEESKKYINKAIAILENLKKKEPKNKRYLRELSFVLHSLGARAQTRGDLLTALNAFLRSLSLSQQITLQEPENGTARREFAIAQNRVGQVLWKQGELKKALKAFEKSIAIIEVLDEPNHPDKGGMLYHLGNLLGELGRIDDARRALEQELHIARRHDGAQSQSVRLSLINLGVLLRDNKLFDDAETLLQEALQIAQNIEGSTSSKISRELSALGKLRADQGRLLEARELYERGLQLLRADPDSEPDAITRLSERLNLVIGELNVE